MAQNMPFRIGAGASCSDGDCGQVSRIIVDPVAREVTHLAVGQKHRSDPGRLVPADLVDAATDEIVLRCTLAEFRALEPARKSEVVPDLDPTGHQEAPRRVNFLPASAGVFLAARGPGGPQTTQKVTVDSVPFGQVDIRPELTVCAADGDVGPVRGIVVEPGGRRVTHLLIKLGGIWGHGEVAVPIDAVVRIRPLSVRLNLTKRQVKHLPAHGAVGLPPAGTVLAVEHVSKHVGLAVILVWVILGIAGLGATVVNKYRNMAAQVRAASTYDRQ